MEISFNLGETDHKILNLSMACGKSQQMTSNSDKLCCSESNGGGVGCWEGVGNYFRIFWKSLLEVKTSELKLEE